VLLFHSFSDDKENAYFAGGIEEEILTRLAKIADLVVRMNIALVIYSKS
jgi:TolB-like protein